MSHLEHHQKAQGLLPRCVVITTSDSRNQDTDESGQWAVERMQAAAWDVISHQIVANDRDQIRTAVLDSCSKGVDFVLTTGGTGMSPRDVTVEVIRSICGCEVVGFGELFRRLSYDEIGPAGMLSRALMGVFEGRTVICCVPGSRPAVQLAMDRLLLSEVPHLLHELGKSKVVAT